MMSKWAKGFRFWETLTPDSLAGLRPGPYFRPPGPLPPNPGYAAVKQSDYTSFSQADFWEHLDHVSTKDIVHYLNSQPDFQQHKKAYRLALQ